MACGSVKCVICGNPVPACQLINGKCGSCRGKEQEEQQQPRIPQPEPKRERPITVP